MKRKPGFLLASRFTVTAKCYVRFQINSFTLRFAWPLQLMKSSSHLATQSRSHRRKLLRSSDGNLSHHIQYGHTNISQISGC
jgi:hypothetical protein